MRLTSIEIKNFASFGPSGVMLDGLQTVNALIGLNNAGKSNVFRAASAVLRHFSSGTFPASPELLSYWHDGELSAPVELALSMNFSTQELEQAGQQSDVPVQYNIGCTLSIPPALVQAISINRTAQAPVSTSVLDQLILQLLVHVPAERRLQPEGLQSVAGIVNASIDGRLRNWLMALEAGRSVTDQQRVEDFKADLRSIPGFELVDYVVTVNQNNSPLVLVNDRPKGYRAPLEECGSGLQMIFLVLAALHERPGRVVLIDEVESNLHPTAQAAFARTVAMRAENTGGQVFFSTHSPSVLEAVPDNAVFEVRRSGARSEIHRPRPEADELFEILREYGYRPALLRLAETILLVEGPSDDLVIRAWWQTLFGAPPEPTMVVLQLGGGVMEHLKPEAMRSLGRRCFAILDSDRTAADAPVSPKALEFSKRMVGVIDTHILERRAIENYFSPEAVRAVMTAEPAPCGPFDSFKTQTPGYGKVAHAGKIARLMTEQSIPDEIIDLLRVIDDDPQRVNHRVKMAEDDQAAD